MTAFRRMGDFVPLVDLDLCLCGHDFLQHSDGVMCIPSCGCEGFDDADPDGDYWPGVYDADDDEVQA